MFIYLTVILIFLVFIELALNYNEKARLLKKVPGSTCWFFFGNTLDILVSPVELMKLGREYAKKWNGIYRFWGATFGAVNIYNPEDIEIITSNMKYSDKSVIYKFLHPWLRGGLLVSNGEKWQARRKLLTPAFHFNILRQFFLVLEENSQRLVEVLGKRVGEDVDIVPVLSEFTLQSICETAMGTQLSEESTGAGRSYKEAIYDIGLLLTHRFTRIYLFPDCIFNLSAVGKKMKDYLSTIHGFTTRVIRHRREYVSEHGVTIDVDIEDESAVYKRKKTAMLDLLLLAEKDGLIDEIGIQEEVDTFMFEGHDTTASGLTFCLMELANNKNIQDKIYSELNEIFGISSRPATMEDLTKMRYLECCVKESLRLYPPVHFISRQLNHKVTLSKLRKEIDKKYITEIASCGYQIPANVVCHIHIIDLHRNPSLYKDPLKFDPDRFLPENSVGRHAYAYIPFSAGSRNCIGQKFAMMEMKIAIAEVLRKFILLPVTRPEDLEFTADLVLRNSGPVYVSFAKRR